MPPTLVWLSAAHDTPAALAAQQGDLGGRATLRTVLGQDLVDPRLDLGAATGRVIEQLAGPTAVFGAGVGALVALRLAAERPDLVPWLAVLPGSPADPPTVLSVWAAVSRLLPGRNLPGLGHRPADALAALDSVRAVDYRPYAGRVTSRAYVICGADDRPGLVAGRALVRRLPRGDLRLVPGAGRGWVNEHPRWVGEVVGRLVEENP